jgi:hypothetical protein
MVRFRTIAEDLVGLYSCRQEEDADAIGENR